MRFCAPEALLPLLAVMLTLAPLLHWTSRLGFDVAEPVASTSIAPKPMVSELDWTLHWELTEADTLTVAGDVAAFAGIDDIVATAARASAAAVAVARDFGSRGSLFIRVRRWCGPTAGRMPRRRTRPRAGGTTTRCPVPMCGAARSERCG